MMNAKKMSRSSNLWIILTAATVTVFMVAGIITYLDYTDKVSVSMQVKNMMLRDNVKAIKKDTGWGFIHCTPTNGECGRLE